MIAINSSAFAFAKRQPLGVILESSEEAIELLLLIFVVATRTRAALFVALCFFGHRN